MILRYTVLLAVLCVLVLGCGARDPGEIRVFAASSLTDVMGTVARDYEAATGTRVRLNLAASSTLARQIVEGAPCDVFLSADEEWADHVEKAGLVVPGSRRVVLTNSLALVVPVASSMIPVGGSSAYEESDIMSTLAAVNLVRRDVQRVAMGDPGHVPVGRYARQRLSETWKQIEPKVVPCESVRAALALVVRGEVDVGVVYRTDARSSPAVRVLLEWTDEAVRYPVTEIRGGSPVACRFTAYLESPAAKAVFERAGFGFPERE